MIRHFTSLLFSRRLVSSETDDAGYHANSRTARANEISQKGQQEPEDFGATREYPRRRVDQGEVLAQGVPRLSVTSPPRSQKGFGSERITTAELRRQCNEPQI